MISWSPRSIWTWPPAAALSRCSWRHSLTTPTVLGPRSRLSPVCTRVVAPALHTPSESVRLPSMSASLRRTRSPWTSEIAKSGRRAAGPLLRSALCCALSQEALELARARSRSVSCVPRNSIMEENARPTRGSRSGGGRAQGRPETSYTGCLDSCVVSNSNFRCASTRNPTCVRYGSVSWLVLCQIQGKLTGYSVQIE